MVVGLVLVPLALPLLLPEGFGLEGIEENWKGLSENNSTP